MLNREKLHLFSMSNKSLENTSVKYDIHRETLLWFQLIVLNPLDNTLFACIGGLKTL